MNILFCKIAWMKHYNGNIDRDEPIGGGQWVKENNDGCEVNNFTLYDDCTYCGYVPTKSDNDDIRQIKLENFEGADKYDDYIDGVLVVWVAQDIMDNKHKIVGWYKNARVYRYYREDIYGRAFNCRADDEDCVLLPIKERCFEVPYSKTNPKRFGMGCSNFWYGKGRTNDKQSQKYANEYVDEVIGYIEDYE